MILCDMQYKNDKTQALSFFLHFMVTIYFMAS